MILAGEGVMAALKYKHVVIIGMSVLVVLFNPNYSLAGWAARTGRWS